jgi:beta-N-acetylhexosaminidase
VAEGLREALDDGRLSRQLFEATVRRLAALREQYRITETPAPLAMPLEEFAASALAIARRGITVRDTQGLLPLPPGTRLAATDCLLSRPAPVGGSAGPRLPDMILQAFPQAAYLALEPDWPAEDEERACALGRRSDAILLVTRNACFIPSQAALAQRLAALGEPLIVAAVRNPKLDALELLDAAIVRTYGDPAVSLRAMVDVLS